MIDLLKLYSTYSEISVSKAAVIIDCVIYN